MFQAITFKNNSKELITLLQNKWINFFYLLNKKNFYVDVKASLISHKYYVATYVYFFSRIIWRGKAYRVRLFKKNNKFTFNFGYSHWTKLIYDSSKFLFYKLGRQNYLVLYHTREQQHELFSLFSNIRKMNKYTKRGIRVKKLPYIRRFGKISQVNSSSHSFG
jgi:hypothetical protein